MASSLLYLKRNTKKKKMKLALSCLGLLITCASMAQSISNTDGYERNENLRELGSTDGTGNVRTFDNRYEGVKGSPYVFAEWYPGEVFLSGKQKVVIKDLNYNCFDNEIAYKDPATEVIRLMNRYKVDFFQLDMDGEKLTFVPLKLSDDGEAVFAEILYDLSSKVYKVYRKEFLKANYEGGYSADRKYDEFVDKSDLLVLKKGDNTLYKIKNSKKYIISIFPDKEKEISAYIKNHKLDLKQDESIVKLLTYYDSL